MNQRAEIISRIAGANNAAEQFEAIAALDLFDKESAARHQADRDVQWADTVVTATLSPVAVHERSTIETDWLGEVTASAEDMDTKVIAEAAAWFGRTSAAVRNDSEEFTEQAKGMARRTASAYGEQAPAAEAAFFDYVSFLLRRQAASGLPQVQQLVDSHENSAQTGLPQDVFDTFGPPVAPINQGVSGTESSERAPLINEIEQEGGGGSTETHHDDSQSFAGPAPVEARPGTQGTTAASHPTHVEQDTCPNCGEWSKGKASCPSCGWKPGDPVGKKSSRITEPLFTPTVGLSHTATLNDFAPGGRFHVEAASGLPQVQQTVDAHEEKPAPTPLPEEVAFPWDLEEAPEIDERSDHKASIEKKRKAAIAYLRGLALQPTAMLTDVQRLQVAAYRKHADQWTQGGEQYHGPGSANSPYTTPEGTGGSYDQGYAEGQSDWRNDEAPTYADDSSAVPPFVKGHSEGYGDAHRQDPTPAGATPGQLPPGAGGFNNGYETHAASRTASLQSQAALMNCVNCGRQDKSYNMTLRGNGQSQEAWCSNCKSPSDNRDQGTHGAPVGMSGNENLHGRHRATKTSSLFVTAVEEADPDFAKAYKYASRWEPGKPLVRRHADKVAFEAGLYAGISDNPGQQVAWEQAHTAAATRYKDKGFLQRIALHRSFSQKVAAAMTGLRAQGSYLVAPVEKTAATSLDLDSGAPQTSPSPTGETPINGPGHTPPMDGGTDAAAPGGPAPYNGAPPYGTPVVTNNQAPQGQQVAIDAQPGAPVDGAAYEHLSPQTHAFRKRVQANLLTTKQS